MNKNLKKSIKRSIKRLFRVSVTAISLVSIGLFAGLLTSSQAIEYTFAERVSYELEEVDKDEIVLDYFLDKLEMCESSGDPTVIVLDTNGLNSRGAYQFQFRTAKHFMGKYGMLDGLEDEDIINLIHNREFARGLAKKIITTEKEGWRHWFNCSRKIGLDKL